MKLSVKLPRLGETVDEMVIMEWEAQVGDDVAEGAVLLRVETDKAIVDVPSPVAGRLLSQEVAEGSEVATGTVVAILESN
ncbi:MAG: 2-oxoglutarate dehydrogenase, component containing protein [Frankiales bacterium]|nr:2-oxoglutarate dehydrogenase, component containing protein [Frankiales bacterium]